MARTTQTLTLITDSLTGQQLEEEATHTALIRIDGEEWTLDLSEASLKKLRAAVSQFTKNEPSRPAGQGRAAERRQSRWPEGYLPKVRAWAKEQGIEVPRVGVVPKTVLAQYEAAQAQA